VSDDLDAILAELRELGCGSLDRPEGFPGEATGQAPMSITRPSHTYDMDAVRENDGEITLHDRIFDRMDEGTIDEPEGTDRRAVMEGRVSVSPLTAPHTTGHHEALDALAETYPAD